jgi:pheromone shutdown protein TraB
MKEYIVKIELGVIGGTFWLAGIVLAKGFWLTLLAAFFPPYGWYLVVKQALLAMGWVAA